MISDPKSLNKHQTILRQLLESNEDFNAAIAAFYAQHAAVHSAQVNPDVPWSYEDEILDKISETQFRNIPANEEHSIAWCIWHLARIEDVTMNVLLAGNQQLLFDGWFEEMGVPFRETGNALMPEEIAALSKTIDLHALREYRFATGRQTHQVVSQLAQGDLRKKVQPARLQRLLDEGAVTEESRGLLDYWSGLTIAGLLLMPPTRHCIVHLNEAARLKKKRP